MSDVIEAARGRIRAVVGTLKEERDRLREIRRSVPVSPQEGNRRDLDRDPDAATEIRSVIACVLEDFLGSAIADLEAAADYRPGRSRAGSPKRPACLHELALPPLDLAGSGETTRRALYELVVRDNFSPLQIDPGTASAEAWVPPYTAEEAGLTVFHAFGRWFATWVKLEEPGDAPEAERRELLRLDPNPQAPGDIHYTEI